MVRPMTVAVAPSGGETWIVEQHQVAAMLTSRSSQVVVIWMHWRSFGKSLSCGAEQERVCERADSTYGCGG